MSQKINKTLLEVDNFSVQFRQGDTQIDAVKEISFVVKEKEIVGIVGESGSGKSVSMLGVMKLLPPHARTTINRIQFQEKNITAYTDEQMKGLWGKEMAYIYQEPSQSYDPLVNIYNTFKEIILTHAPNTHKDEIEKRSIALLEEVGIINAKERLHSYFHQFSGGMIQRVQIALALTFHPTLLIADEPTTALDVTTQKIVVDLLLHLCKKKNMSLIFITHDLALISTMVDRIFVMENGRIVEEGSPNDILYYPKHTYTKKLLSATINFGDRYDKR